MVVKKIISVFLLCLLSLNATLFFLPSQVSAQIIAAQPGELLVTFKNNPELYKFKTTPDQNLDQLIQKYRQRPDVELIEPNFTFTAADFPNDPDRPLQYYLNMINARNAWSQELLVREQESITNHAVLAILDTGIDLNHPDLKSKIWKNIKETATDGKDNDSNGFVDDVTGWDFVDNDNDPSPSLQNPYDEDAAKHGTIVAGIAAAATNNGSGISGVGWFVDIMPLRVLNSSGSGDVFSVVKAIDYAVANGATVISMSFVGNGYSKNLADAIQQAYSKGVIVVAAAGNTDPATNGVNLNTTKAYPVCYDNTENIVIGVASISPNYKKSSFSNYGNCIDIAAPGEGIYSTQLFNASVTGFTKAYDGYWSGTSLAAPMVSGALAAARAIRPGFSVGQIRDFLLASAQDVNKYNPGFEGQLGSGLFNFDDFIKAVLGTKEPINNSGQVASYVVAGLGYKSFPQVKIMTSNGLEFKNFFAYDPRFNGPINVATGDVAGDGKSEIVTAAGVGGGPHVKVLNIEGQTLAQFFAYDSKFRGGVNVAVGNIDGFGKQDIVTAPGKGQIPEIKVFDYQGNLISKFLAYDAGFTGGVKVAVGDVDGDGIDEIVTGAGAGGGPHVRVFNAQGTLISQFFAFNQNFKGGVNVAVGDLRNDGKEQIAVAVESNSVPTVRVYNYLGELLTTFFAYEPNFLAGVNIAIGDADGDGLADIVTGKAKGGNAEVNIFNLRGGLKSTFNIKPQGTYTGGVRPAVLE